MIVSVFCAFVFFFSISFLHVSISLRLRYHVQPRRGTYADGIKPRRIVGSAICYLLEKEEGNKEKKVVGKAKIKRLIYHHPFLFFFVGA